MPPQRQKKFVIKRTSIPDSANSAKFLVIVESPSKCKKIEAFLGRDYCCIASLGHIRYIDGLKSIDASQQYAVKFDILAEKRDHIDILKTVVRKFKKENVILATDDDREGEAIAWHICEVCNLDPVTTHRILFHEITEHAVKHAIQHPTKINMNLVQAANARQVLDMLVGFKISPLLWKYLYCNKKNSLSAGRCQTPALRLVYDNAQQKMSRTTENMLYKITAVFLEQRLHFHLDTDKINTREQAQQFLEASKTHQHKLSVGKTTETRKSAPKPFSTSRLLQTASNRLHMSPKECMTLCQKLYQDGWITYMRTDSTKYSAEFLQQARTYIREIHGEDKLGDFTRIENIDTANPHEAIRVTHIGQHTIAYTPDTTRMNALYRMIWRNTVESCMIDAHYECTEITVTSPITDAKYIHVLEIPLQLGWKLAVKETTEYEDKEEEYDQDIATKQRTIHYVTQQEGRSLLMYLRAIHGFIPYRKISANVVMRNMQIHYSQASLIKKLEELGIGRPSTFAMLVDTIEERGYVKCQDVDGTTAKITEFVLQEGGHIYATVKEKTFGQEKKKLVIQPVGIMTVEFLIQHFNELFSYDYTKHMEMELDMISKGDKNAIELCEKCDTEIKGWMKPVANTVKKEVFEIVQGEPEPGHGKYVVSIGQYGPVLKRAVLQEDGKKITEYMPIKRGLNLEMTALKNGIYHLEDLMEVNLGEYEGYPLTIKEGKYGAYIQWGENRESLKGIGIKLDKLEREDVIRFLQNKLCNTDVDKTSRVSGVRVINENLSIRVGKYGPYIFYKTVHMKKPAFYPMKNFPLKYIDCDLQLLLNWIKTNYKIE